MEKPQVPLTLKLICPTEKIVERHLPSSDLFHAFLAGLQTGICSESELIEFGLEYGGSVAAACVINWLNTLKDLNALSFVLHDHGRFLAECYGDFSGTARVDTSDSLYISPHVFFRQKHAFISIGASDTNAELLIPHAIAQVLLDTRLQLGAWMVRDVIDWLENTINGLTGNAIHNLISLLFRAGICIKEQDHSGKKSTSTLMWEFHDLLFHTRTTQGHGNFQHQGATYRFSGKIPPEPALRKVEWPRHKQLVLSHKLEHTIDFWEVIKRRRSPPIDVTNVKDIDLELLESFLTSLAVLETSPTPCGAYEFTKRLYPGAGACYELEVFPLIMRCEGIERGFYYYNPEAHSLHKVSGWTSELESLVKTSIEGTGRIITPAVVMFISSRFNRLAWKYEGIAYSLCLKDLGVVFQFMYLIAAALELEVCALGSAEAGLFSKITGIDRFQEPLVGQFMIVGKR